VKRNDSQARFARAFFYFIGVVEGKRAFFAFWYLSIAEKNMLEITE
jgi:hypothetical protein